MYQLKRALDLCLSVISLLAVLPLLALIGVLVSMTMGRPVFFRQTRPGLGGRPFVIYKFRTMRSGSEPDAERLTKLGRFLRRLSLDELPELWNVLKGDMSLVGPRPLLMQYLERYTPEQARRHQVKPGITGWAQVKGRAAVAYEERFVLDVWYVDHNSVWLDLRIVLRTPFEVFRGRGVTAPGYATGPEFLGSRSQGRVHEGHGGASQSGERRRE